MINILKYARGVYKEYQNIVWPNQSEIVSSCIVVVIVSLIFSSFLFCIDFIIIKVVSMIFFGS